MQAPWRRQAGHDPWRFAARTSDGRRPNWRRYRSARRPTSQTPNCPQISVTVADGLGVAERRVNGVQPPPHQILVRTHAEVLGEDRVERTARGVGRAAEIVKRDGLIDLGADQPDGALEDLLLAKHGGGAGGVQLRTAVRSQRSGPRPRAPARPARAIEATRSLRSCVRRSTRRGGSDGAGARSSSASECMTRVRSSDLASISCSSKPFQTRSNRC